MPVSTSASSTSSCGQVTSMTAELNDSRQSMSRIKIVYVVININKRLLLLEDDFSRRTRRTDDTIKAGQQRMTTSSAPTRLACKQKGDQSGLFNLRTAPSLYVYCVGSEPKIRPAVVVHKHATAYGHFHFAATLRLRQQIHADSS
eukprot:3443563-Pleurochrysis_carterae.AAC.1